MNYPTTTYNLAFLVSVKVRDIVEVANPKFTFKITKKYKNGAYFPDNSSTPFSADDLIAGKLHQSGIKLLVQNEKVYFYPEVSLLFADGSQYHKTFDDYTEASNFANEQIAKAIPDDKRLVIRT